MTNKTETPPQAERQAYLAEYMSVEVVFSHGRDPERRYLLQRECPNIVKRRETRIHPLHCPMCNATGYVYDDSPNALTEAIRAKGWSCQINILPPEDAKGDIVVIFDGSQEWAVHVRAHEGYRWPEVVEVALYRACRAEAGENDK